jgi:hypothetical protein
MAKITVGDEQRARAKRHLRDFDPQTLKAALHAANTVPALRQEIGKLLELVEALIKEQPTR